MKETMSWSRFLSSSLLIVLTALAIVYSYLFIVVVVLLTAGGLYEFFYMVKKKDVPIYSYTGIFIGVLIPISIFTHFEPTHNWELLFIVIGFLLILFMQFARQDNRHAILGLSTTLFGVLYVAWFFSFLVKIRNLLPGMDGVKLVGFILLVTKSADMGALLIGTNFGKHPLLSKVSPNKSIEGTVGGVLVSACVALIFRSFLPPALDLPRWQIFLMGAFFGGLGQLGDLSESLIKRDCGVKDSGKLLPAMGGVLDVIDSLLFSAPAFYLYISSALTMH
ncbi:MAG: phosphatidate cytidylyltransferase [Candidatus Omnitrophica bacterium]|nr:phosphatidate cytidylyltransferase [Candidatus Omnitrophota bacterium]MDE2009959.1 phosphatidate cytidylyltransferase [Candidatus Omnitrophota bacterium]MDE2213937.1 phosphatidate cytidylyltransferase [Candidatus Omnitrophota bacterium]MDE2231913.1 phosphatidate cytidylyltransferase [Candidatus Omnitrophota bacterium]